MNTDKTTMPGPWHVVPVLNGWRAWSDDGQAGDPATHDLAAVRREVARRNLQAIMQGPGDGPTYYD